MLAVFALAALAAAQPISKEEKSEGFKPLFNGRNLSEWKGDAKLWKEIGIKKDAFLATSRDSMPVGDPSHTTRQPARRTCSATASQTAAR